MYALITDITLWCFGIEYALWWKASLVNAWMLISIHFTSISYYKNIYDNLIDVTFMLDTVFIKHHWNIFQLFI